MAKIDKKKLSIELYDNALTGRKDDRIGRVVGTGRRTIDDLVNIVASRRTDINPVTLRASYDLLYEAAMEETCEGASVEFGPVNISVKVRGPFYGDNPSWDPSVNSLQPSAIPNAAFRKAVKDIPAQLRGMATVGVFINTVTDVTTGQMNTCLTPGGGVNLTGSKMKIGTGEEEGIRLIRQDNGEETIVPMTSVLVNKPSCISFIVPASLPPGDYCISITTAYTGSGNVSLKVPRTFVFDQILMVETA